MKKIFFYALVLVLGFSACSSGDTKEHKHPMPSPKKEIAKAKKAAPTPAPKAEPAKLITDGKVVLSSDDQMKYDQTEIRVKGGQEISLTLKHVGKMKKEVMGHNFVLLKQGTDLAKFAAEAGTAAATDYIPKGNKSIIANTKTIGGGESVTIKFAAPAAGTYDYICSFPGHYAIMNGKLIVE